VNEFGNYRSGLKREIITTGDGSTTLQIKDWNEQYHSKHGAIQEAYHVFIKNGLSLFDRNDLAILEIGFGTGLNALITYLEGKKTEQKIRYTGVEKYPITLEEFHSLNYISELQCEAVAKDFRRMHEAPFEEAIVISENFQLTKLQKDFRHLDFENTFNLVYFDAFGARVQPDLWTEAIFLSMFKALKSGGVLVTYAAKGSVRRAMQAVGFLVERLPGPPGKREMLRATKPVTQ